MGVHEDEARATSSYTGSTGALEMDRNVSPTAPDHPPLPLNYTRYNDETIIPWTSVVTHLPAYWVEV